MDGLAYGATHQVEMESIQKSEFIVWPKGFHLPDGGDEANGADERLHMEVLGTVHSQNSQLSQSSVAPALSSNPMDSCCCFLGEALPDVYQYLPVQQAQDRVRRSHLVSYCTLPGWKVGSSGGIYYST